MVETEATRECVMVDAVMAKATKSLHIFTRSFVWMHFGANEVPVEE